jgi:16S rRNA (guanine527-N7)-methyltransferase
MSGQKSGEIDREELLRSGCKRIGLPVHDYLIKSLLVYCDEIELWNRRSSLVAASGVDLVIKHILDCLAGLPHISEYLGAGRTMADLGSGAGFPGVPIALLRSEVIIDLIERSGKKAVFLRNIAAILAMENIRVVEADYRKIKMRYDVLTFRALLPLDRQFIQNAAKLLNPNGLIAAYKGKLNKVNAELAAVADVIDDMRVFKLEVPFLEEERHLVLFKPGRCCQSC